MSGQSFEFATLGAGCFWGVEHLLKKIPGVLDTTCGYAGGSSPDPTYKEVKTGKTNHAEVVLIKFDPNILSYHKLLEYFWRLHDPTQLNRQGVDVGTQYRSVIFYHSEQQKQTAEQSKKEFDQSHVFPTPSVTQILPTPQFFSAEDYHQDYFDLNGGHVCHIMREK